MASASEKLDTIWPAPAHTLAKHAVLREYLNAWFPILSTGSSYNNSEPLYIDGFAGPGEYEGGEPGSPILAITAANVHKFDFRTPVHFLFVEKNKKRFEHLTKLVEKTSREKGNRNIGKIDVKQGECDEEINALLDSLENKGISFGPALAFLDQFGFAGVSMELIKRILSHDKCETFIYLDYEGINRFGYIADRAPALNRVFGNSDWLPFVTSEEKLRKFYLKSLKEHAGAEYAYAFSMFDSNGTPLNWLVFCTRHWYGMQMMKKAMWKVDKTGSFRFSDKDDPDQLKLLEESFDDSWLADELFKNLQNQTLTVAQMRDYVLSETPCYLFNDAFKILEVERKAMEAVTPPSGRRKGSFVEFEGLQFKFKKYEPIFVQQEMFG